VRHAWTSVGAKLRSRTQASWSPSTSNTSAPGIERASLRCRAVGTSSSRVVTTTAAGTSTVPIQSWDEKRVSASAAWITVAGSWPRKSSRTRSRSSGCSMRTSMRVIMCRRAAPGTRRTAAAAAGSVARAIRATRRGTKWRAVAHSTSPATCRGWRCQVSAAIGPPIE
jgi:hypothetical protein